VEGDKKTIVVFGTGIDQTYPAGNASLFEEVIKK
jgi:predicted Rossmann fold nucleotide-binding protein DprA/Smf involved in DNA uptake